MKIRAALLVLLCAGAAAARPLLVFRGNVLFDEMVYRSVLNVPDTAEQTPAGTAAIVATLRGFLRRAGYELATVRADVAGDQVSIDIDEGRLDKIIIIGEGLVETFRFRLDLALPSGI